MLRLSAVLIAAVVANAAAQSPKGVTQQGNAATQVLIDIEGKWNDALVKKDVAALDAIVADGYVTTDEQGRVRDKAAMLARVRSGTRNFQSMKLTEIHVHLFGDVAVVTGV